MKTPDFFLVGAPKCGTSLMDTYLSRHPDVFMCSKEPHYFGSDLAFNNPPRTLENYLALFEGADGAQRVGDSSVWYLWSRVAAQEIKDFSPDAHILIMLRNPVSMMHSLHSHLLYTADEDIADFAEALAAEPDRRAGRRIPPYSFPKGALQYRDVARFGEQIERYYAVFGRDKVLVVLADDFKKDGAGTYKKVLGFLGLRTDFEGFDDALKSDNWTANVNKTVRSQALQRWLKKPERRQVLKQVLPEPFPGYRTLLRALRRANIVYADRPPMDPALRRRLTEEMAPEVAKLGELIGRDLSSWSKLD